MRQKTNSTMNINTKNKPLGHNHRQESVSLQFVQKTNGGSPEKSCISSSQVEISKKGNLDEGFS